MIHIPIMRWGKAYKSLVKEDVVHFRTGEKLAEVSQANAGLVNRDMRQANRARDVLREFSVNELMEKVKAAADLYLSKDLPLGEATQGPDDFVKYQSATTGLPENMCRLNMKKNHFVLTHMEELLGSLTRGLDLEILRKGYGIEKRGVPLSYQAQSPILGLVLPSNSPGVHTLWMPIIPLQIGLVLKPGPQEPWTPYRMSEAFFQAGIPRETISIYPGGADVGAAVLGACSRALVFGGSPTVDLYKSNPSVQVHGPGFSKILLGDDVVDNWHDFLDVMVDSVLVNSGRSCISCSGIWASRHTEEIAEALAKRLGPVAPLPPEDPDSALAAFTVSGVAASISDQIDKHLDEEGAKDITAEYRDEGRGRLVENERCDYLRPTVIHCDSPRNWLSNQEYMFPFVSVVKCPQREMIGSIGPTLVGSAITEDEQFRRNLVDAVHIDRLNIGAIPTIQLNWLQPHEGSIVDFLFRARAYQEF